MAWVSKGSIKGPQGDKGDAATVTVGETVTGDAGTQASVANTGAASAAVLKFTVPKGEKGAPGETGAPGEPGPAGATGPCGTDGAGVSSGEGVPTESGSEVSGDLYVDLSTGDVYSWTA